MKPKFHLNLTAFLVLSFSLTSFSMNIYKHQIIQSEADELNKLGDALGISETGWPVAGEEYDAFPNISGVGFIVSQTVFKGLVPNATDPSKLDSLFVRKYKVNKIEFGSKNYSTSLPDLSFDLLKKFYLNNCKLEGEIPSLNFPECTELDLGNNKLTGEIPDFDLPKLEKLELSSNSFTGKLRLFTGLPSLKYLGVRTNKLTSIDLQFGLPNLETFYANDNDYSGTFPSFNCPKLQGLYLAYEDFSGEIPKDMILPSCKRLEINNNNFSGSLPELNLPSLTYLNVAHNKLTGEIPVFSGMPMLDWADLGFNGFTSIAPGFTHPTLRVFYAWECKLTGKLTAINLPKGEILSLSGNKLSGNIPVLNCPNLTFLNLGLNEFTGTIPNFKMPKLENLNLYKNKLTGEIPNFNMPYLRYLYLHNNQLTGKIPVFDCPLLEEIKLYSNKLEGALPNFTFPNLKELLVAGNQLSGPIPNFELPNLKYLELSSNNFTGNLPAFVLPSLKSLIVANNKLTGLLPLLTLPSIDALNLSDNQFSGPMPKWNLPTLNTLRLENNFIEGFFDNTGLPGMKNCLLNNNLLSGIGNLLQNSPNLYNMQVNQNRLTFEDLEPNKNISNFFYENQDSVEHSATVTGNQVALVIKVGGTANKYQWTKKMNNQGWEDIIGATKDSVVVSFEKNTKYSCKISNTIITGLTLYSKEGKAPSCISIGNLQFCSESSSWEAKEENETGTTGKVSINNLLNFEGNITIDTVKLTVKADGEFYISDIPIPGGTIGKYSFCKGEYDLKLLGEEGAITNFLDSKFDQLGQLFGIDLKLANLELVGGRSATGIKLDCKVGIPGISGSCGEGGDVKTEIDLAGISFSKTGISLDGIAITDLGLLLDGYCLKSLIVNYDSEKDILISGAHIALPFGEIGGGFKLSQGYLDSIAWHLEAAKPPFVLGTTTIGIKGFFGHFSGIKDTPYEIELGGIFTDITSENFYLVNASGRTVWPSIFEVKGEGKFLKPPFIGKPYQVNGGVSMAYDHPMQMFKIGFNGKLGTSDEKSWLLQGTGDLKLSTKFEIPVMSGEIEGKMELQKFDDKFPYNWLNSMFSFPMEANSQATFVWGKSHILHGTTTFQTETRGPYGLRYVINLEKNYGDEDFLYFETQVETKSAKLKSGNLINETAEVIQIPENTQFAVIGVISKTKAPVSTLKNPSGKIYSNSADEVVYTTTADGKEAFWTLKAPAKGNWEVVLKSPAANDSILLFVQQKPAGLKVSVNQTGKSVKVSWDPLAFSGNQSVTVLLDDNNSGFDGFAVAEGNASLGSISFEMSDLLSACSYHLFVQISNETSTVQAYADKTVANPKAILGAPVITEARYQTSTGKTQLKFTNSNDLNAIGYIIEVADAEGNDSLYSIVNYGNTLVELNIANHENKSVKMTSFNSNGLQGCPSEPFSIITTDIKELGSNGSTQNSLLFYPNPTSGKGTIKFSIEEDEFCNLSVVDFYGRIMDQPVNEKKPSGTYEKEWDFGNLPNGMYLIVLRTKKSVITTKCILNR